MFFIDKIFDSHDSMITRNDFVTSIAGDMDEMAKCDWIFSPLKLRNILLEHVDFDEYKDIIDNGIV